MWMSGSCAVMALYTEDCTVLRIDSGLGESLR